MPHHAKITPSEACGVHVQNARIASLSMNQRSAGHMPDDSRRPVRPAPKAAFAEKQPFGVAPFPAASQEPASSAAVLMSNAPLIQSNYVFPGNIVIIPCTGARVNENTKKAQERAVPLPPLLMLLPSCAQSA